MKEATHYAAPLGETHSHTIIFLHGRDSVASEFAEEFFESQASDDRTLPEIFPTLKWVFPASKIRKSARFEADLSQWFDMWSVENPSENSDIQLNGLRESTGEILSIIQEEALLVPPERIILGGISQGCATAIYALLCGGVRLGGFIGLCSWLPFQEAITTAAQANSTNTEISQRARTILYGASEDQTVSPDLSGMSGQSMLGTPIFLSHSQDDEVVPFKNGTELSESLKKIGLEVTWKMYKDGGHWINEPQGVDDMVRFIREQVVVPEEAAFIACT